MAPHCARNPKTATIVRVAEKAIQLNRLQGKPWRNPVVHRRTIENRIGTLLTFCASSSVIRTALAYRDFARPYLV
jgi:hypothetical protein